MENNYQRTQEWNDKRNARITSSEFWKLMVEPKSGDGISETTKTYILDKVAEALTGIPKTFSNEATAYGTDMETLAKRHICAKYNTDITESDFWIHPTMKYYGGSPDGIINIDGTPTLLEIKAPFNTTIHLQHILQAADLQKHKKEYFYQIVSNMYLTNTKQALFVSFDPRIDNENGLYCQLINLDEADISLMLMKLELAWKEYVKLALKFGLDIIKHFYPTTP